MNTFFRFLRVLACAMTVLLNAAAAPELSIGDVSAMEGTGTTNRFRFPVTLSEPAGAVVSVNFSASSGTAIAGQDFSNTASSVIFAIGQLVSTASVRIATDAVFENNEIFEVVLFAPTNATIADDLAIGTILNDDPAPVLSVGNVSASEGSGGTTFFSFPMALNAASPLDASFSFAVSNGTALAGSDFVATNGMIFLASGATAAVVVVEVFSDLLFENDETFTLNLFEASNVSFFASSTVGTIENDDMPPTISIAPTFAQTEGSGSKSLFLIPVALSTNVEADASVSFQSTIGSASGGTDFDSTNGVLVIPAGSVTGFIAVAIFGDSDFELDETFFVTISSPANATLGNAETLVTILDDDSGADVTIADLQVNEGTGGTGVVQVAVSLSQPVIVDVSVDFATTSGTAQAGTDFVTTNGTLVIPAGQTNGLISVRINRDTQQESAESFEVLLSNPMRLTILDSNATITLLNDDTNTVGIVTPSISVGNVTSSEGTGGVTPFSFTVLLSETTDVDVTAGFATSNGTALAEADFTGTTGTLLIVAGQLSATVTVEVVADAVFENAEIFTLNLFDIVNASNGVVSGIGTILDDELPPIANIATNFSQVEGSGTTNTFLVPVVLSTSVQANVIISYSLVGETADSFYDFDSGGNQLVITAGNSTGFVAVAVYGDTAFELDETFTIQINSVSNATLAAAACTATILNDDSGADIFIGDVTVAEGSGGLATLLVPVTLSASVIANLSVNFSTISGTALAGSDFTATNGTVVIPSGQTNANIAILINGDVSLEDDESFTITLSNPTNGTIITGTSTITLLNDDATPTLSVSDATLAEGNSDATNFVFTVSLSAARAVPVSVNLSTSNGTAAGGSDYTAKSETLVIPAGEISSTFFVSVSGDTLFEADETFSIHLFAPTNATIADSHGLGIIQNDDAPPSINIAGASQLEGNSGSSNFAFAATLSSAAGVPVSVSFTTSNGTATAGSDYLSRTGTLVFAAGDIATAIVITVIGDTLFEIDEEFSVNLFAPSNATLEAQSALGSILNDESFPTLSIGSITQAEGNAGSYDLVLPIVLSTTVVVDVSVDFSTSNGTAVSGADFIGTNGSLVIVAGSRTGFVTIAMSGDLSFESNETFTLNLSNPVNATIDTAQSVISLLNDDALPALSIAPVQIIEGNAGGNPYDIPVSVSIAAGVPISVQFSTSNGSATVGSDYTATNGILVIEPDALAGFITIEISPDVNYESNETFTVHLANPLNATLASTDAVMTILNDDPIPALSIENASALEGNGGSTEIAFPVKLSSVANFPISVRYVTSNATAIAGSDFVGATGLIFLAAGQSSTAVIISINGDVTPEGNETFTIHLFSPSNAPINIETAVGTILNDEANPTLSIGSVIQAEGNVATTTILVPVTLSQSSDLGVSVSFMTLDGTAMAAGDYSPTNGTLFIPSGSRTGFVSIAVSGESLFEYSETVLVRLSDPINADLVSSQAVVTILNDDSPPALSIGVAEAFEGDSGPTDFFVPITLSQAAGVDVTFTYLTSNGTALADGDYLASTGSLTIAAGATGTFALVTVNGDTTPEGNETFMVHLSDSSNATIFAASGQVTILDDEQIPELSIGDVVLEEGNFGLSLFQIQVVLSSTSSVDVSLSFSTSNSSALAGSDYSATNGTLVIPAGLQTGIIVVAVSGDATFETDETFLLTIFSPDAATIADGESLVTIDNDDAPPTISIADVAQLEGDSGTTDVLFTISMSATAGVPVSVNFSTSNGSAEAGSDFAFTNGIIQFPVGESSGSISVAVNGDTSFEPDETFFITLDSPTNATIAAPQCTATILDDDGIPGIAIGNATLAEGSSGFHILVLPAVLSTSALTDVTVEFSTSNGTADGESDFIHTNGTLLIQAGTRTGLISIVMSGDSVFESDEFFTVILSNPSNTYITAGTGTVTLTNDDAAPTLSVQSATRNEGNAGMESFDVQLSLSEAAGTPITVQFTTSNGTATAGSDYTATAGSDYTATNGTLVIAPGTFSGIFISLMLSGDTRFENDESFTLNLLTPSNATLVNTSATITLLNDDTPPTIAIGDINFLEGSGESNAFVQVPVNLSAEMGFDATVDFFSTDITAFSGSDYSATNGSLVIPANTRTGFIAIAISGDTAAEPDETFSITLSNAAVATIANTQAIVTIINDDGIPSISIGSYSANEGDSGTTAFVFDLALTEPHEVPVTVRYATSNQNATAGTDFAGETGTVTFAIGQTATSITILVSGEATYELDETFTVNLFDATNALISTTNSGTGTILNDDFMPSLAIADVTQNEGTSSTNTLFLIPITVSPPSGVEISVGVTIFGFSATAGSDFVNTNVTLLIAPNTPTGYLPITVTADANFEISENFSIQLTDPVNATLDAGQALVTIADDDGPPGASIFGGSVIEGDTVATSIQFIVTLNHPSDFETTIQYSTSDDTASSSNDYDFNSGVINFPAGETATVISVIINPDTTFETNETFTVTLFNPDAATITVATATGTILNDDAPPPPLTGYDLWASLLIPDELQRGYQDDPDLDGYVNLLEYVTGANPDLSDELARLGGVRTNGTLALQFTHDTNTTDATLIIEGAYSATDNTSWLSFATNLIGSWGSTTNITIIGTNPVTVTVPDPTPASNRFLRLRVIRP